jgi:diguanylate cyclase (GGDEF)-like protein
MTKPLDVFLRIDINLIAMLLLGIVWFIANNRLDRQDAINKSFLIVSAIIVVELVLETVTCIINRKPELWLIPVSVICHVFLFITGAVLTYYWFLFVQSLTATGSPAKNKWNNVLFIPVAVNTLLTLLSPLNKLLFYITPDNVYHRGPLFIVSAIIIYFYLLLGLGLIVIKRRKFVKQEFLPLCILVFLPLLGGFFQSVFYGALLMWSTTAFSLIIVYILLKDRMVHLDYLTGTWDRQTFEHFLSRLSKAGNNEERAIIYIDIDDLKRINDEYGHIEGDHALKTAIGIVRSAIRKNDMIARLGGDEFAVILNSEDCSRTALDTTVRRIEAAFEAHNTKSEKPYPLHCSLGADIFTPGKQSIKGFMAGIDARMYEHKKNKKPDSDRL